MLRERFITSLWFVPLFIVVTGFGGEPGFTALVTIFGVLGALEFYRMVSKAKVPPLTVFGLVWVALFIISRSSGLVSLMGTHFNTDLLLPLLLTSAIIIPLLILLGSREKNGVLNRWVWTLAGILYLGFLLGHLTALRGLPDGRPWVYFALFTTWVSDTAAYFIGRKFGKHKLAPDISPGKTWEGAIGGLAGAALTSIMFFTPTIIQLPASYRELIPLSLLVSALGQAGDLIESLMKRNMAVKDSGILLTGHGGILDRIDSLIFAGAVVYYFAMSFNGGWAA
jgi:phosphatidate cytidylyltransferase